MQHKIQQDLHELNFTALDFETANEKRHSACSIGLVQVRGGQVVERRQYLIRPVELRVEPINYSIHRISVQQLRTAPSWPELWPLIEPFVHEQLVVAHNAAFDMSVLDKTLLAYDLPTPAFHAMCSVKLAKAAFPHLERARLSDLATHFGLTLNHHDSLSDAEVCAEITLRALRSGHPFAFCFKQRELTKGLGTKPKPFVGRRTSGSWA
ncbi:3'-5' exonuclease [Hymenobacter koreensis]